MISSSVAARASSLLPIDSGWTTAEVRALMDAGADASLKSVQGMTTLDYAQRHIPIRDTEARRMFDSANLGVHPHEGSSSGRAVAETDEEGHGRITRSVGARSLPAYSA